MITALCYKYKWKYKCMPQITIYLDAETAQKMEAAARKAGVSKSRWIAEAVRQKSSDEWPQEVRELAGAWKDLPDLPDVRKFLGKDVPREPL
jgi:hypothetical protein